MSRLSQLEPKGSTAPNSYFGNIFIKWDNIKYLVKTQVHENTKLSLKQKWFHRIALRFLWTTSENPQKMLRDSLKPH